MRPWTRNIGSYCDRVDKVMIPAANHLNPEWDMGEIADLIETLDKEVFVTGLGAQAQNESDEFCLQPGTLRYLKVLSNYAKTVFVRGQFTAEICEKFGVKNVEPIGCPSITINPTESIGRIVESRFGQPFSRLYCAGATFKQELAYIESSLFRIIKTHPGSSYIVQDPEYLIELIISGNCASKILDEVRDFLEPGTSRSQFFDDFRRVARFYMGIEEWMEGAARHEYSICTRIHGGILSLVSGVPTVIIGHDTRVRELCDAMLIPWIPVDGDAEIFQNIPAIFDRVRFNGADFDANRCRVAQIYTRALIASGLTPADGLVNISREESSP